MSRSVSWRRVCSDPINTRIEEAYEKIIYIVHQTGPTGFVLKQEGEEKKFKVFLGDPHTCTCSVFRKENELCIHILWLLLKKFRIPKTNPIIFQLGLIEREIHELLYGYLTRQSPKQKESTELAASNSCHQRPVSTDDICPICQDDLLGRPQRLTFCKYGCGQSVHLKCIKEWADHQKQRGEAIVACPLCREKFCSFEELRQNLQVSAKERTLSDKGIKESLHFGIFCNQCQVCPISGKCYKCTSCSSFYLCHVCFENNHHLLHSFQVQQNPGQPWRPAARPISLSMISQSVINDIQMRELTENDYETLLQLDAAPLARPRPATLMPDYVLNSFRSEPLDRNHCLLTSGSSCLICKEVFQRGDWIRKMPCKHKFHRDCIDSWLVQGGHLTCPIDGKTLYSPGDKSKKGTRRTGHLYSPRDQETTTPKEINMSISGHGIGNGSIGTVIKENQPRDHVPTIRKGSAITTPKQAHSPVYISLNITSYYSNVEPTTPRLSSNRKRNSYPFQPSSLHYSRLGVMKMPQDKSKLPKIIPPSSRGINRGIKSMNSVLHVSSLKTTPLPPINATYTQHE